MNIIEIVTLELATYAMLAPQLVIVCHEDYEDANIHTL